MTRPILYIGLKISSVCMRKGDKENRIVEIVFIEKVCIMMATIYSAVYNTPHYNLDITGSCGSQIFFTLEFYTGIIGK